MSLTTRARRPVIPRWLRGRRGGVPVEPMRRLAVRRAEWKCLAAVMASTLRPGPWTGTGQNLGHSKTDMGISFGRAMSDRAEPGRARASSVDVDCPPGAATSTAVTTQASGANARSAGVRLYRSRRVRCRCHGRTRGRLGPEVFRREARAGHRPLEALESRSVGSAELRCGPSADSGSDSGSEPVPSPVQGSVPGLVPGGDLKLAQ